MNNKVLAEAAGRFKFKEEGVRRMCAIFEEIRREGYDAGLKANSKKIAMNCIKLGSLSLETIAKATGLTLAELEELKTECDS